MTWQISPFGNDQFFSSNGVLAVGYKLYTYLAGTTTKEAAAAAFDGLSFHTNPIVLNSLGMPPSPIYIDIDKSYKFVYATNTDTDPPGSPLYTADNVTVRNLSSVLSDWVSGTTPTYISATQFSVTGDQRTAYHVGRRVRLVAVGSTVYGVISASVFGSVTTITVLVDDGLTISASLSAVSYGLLSAAGSAWPVGFNTGLLTTFVADLVVRTSTPSVRLIGLEGSAKDYLIQENAGKLQSFINTGTETSPTWTEDEFFASPGDVKFGAYSATPPGWLPCDGTAVSRTTYARLFTAISTQFGVGDGSTTFNVPDVRGRTPIMVDGAANRITSASTNGVNADTLGGVGGAETHTLVTAELAAHEHQQQAVFLGGGVNNSLNTAVTTNALTFNNGGLTASTGGGGAHSNTQPWIALNAYIKT